MNLKLLTGCLLSCLVVACGGSDPTVTGPTNEAPGREAVVGGNPRLVQRPMNPAPSPAQPQNPQDPNQPKNPDPNQPKNPDPNQPKNPDPNQPKNPDPNQPKNPDPNQPKNPDPNQPKNPDPNQPKNPDPQPQKTPAWNGVSDYRAMPETPIAMPAAGGSYIDPDFKNKIIRVTDSAGLTPAICANSYSYVPAFNADSSRLIVGCANVARIYSFDKTTDAVALEQTLSDGQAYALNWESAFWSGSKPNIVYVLGAPKGKPPTVLYQVDVSRHDSARFVALVDLKTKWNETSFEVWQLGKSEDDRVFTFHSRDLAGNPLHVGAYLKDVSRFVAFPDDKFQFNESQVDKAGHYILVNGDRNDSYRFRVWDPYTNTVVDDLMPAKVDGTGGHYDLGQHLMVNTDRFGTGQVVRTWGAMHAPKNIVHYYLPDGKTLNWAIADHVSMRNDDESFIVGSTYGVMNPQWPAFQREIYLARTDGSGFLRLAHTRSKGNVEYWSQPHAVVDRSGRYVAFSSDHGTSQVDVFILKMQ